MTAPPANLPRKHLHTLPHGTALPDGATVEDGYPFLLEVSGVRTLYQNNNGTFEQVSSAGGDLPVSPSGVTWDTQVSDLGRAFPIPKLVAPVTFVEGFTGTDNGSLDALVWSMPGGTDVLYGVSANGQHVGKSAGDGFTAYASHDMGSGDVEIRAEIVALPSTGNFVGLIGRTSAVGVGYAAKVDHAGVLTLNVENGGETVLGTGTVTVAVGAVLSLSMNGSAISATATNQDGTQATATATDTALGNTFHASGLYLSSGQLARLWVWPS